MRPVLTPEQLRTIDRETVRRYNITSLKLMERAAGALAPKMLAAWNEDGRQPGKPALFFCGRGNNGGDGYVVARLWHELGIPVMVFDCAIGDASPDNAANRERLSTQGVEITEIHGPGDLPLENPGGPIIDALFGTGLSRPVAGPWAKLIARLNDLPNHRYAIDVPSGLFIAEPTDGPVFRAHRTFSLGYAKPAEFLPEAAQWYGKIERVDFALADTDVLTGAPFASTFERDDTQKAYRPRGKYDHKGTFGHALLVAGAKGTMGAAVLSARAALSSGAGLLTCHVPAVGYQIMQISVPEAMCLTDGEDHYLTEVGGLSRYRAIGVGPGIGREDETAEMLRDLVYRAEVPLVIDADALNILGEHRDWWQHVPAGSILTPHPKEFDRLFGPHEHTLSRWATQRIQSADNGWTIVLKGGHTTVSAPDGSLTINTNGNPGMATAGAGDVLTGIILALVCQGYTSPVAARLGVYVHGAAGDFDAIMAQEPVTAGGLIDVLGWAFGEINDVRPVADRLVDDVDLG